MLSRFQLPEKIAQSFLHLIYPPLCLHCSQTLPNGDHPLCQSCLSLMEMIDPTERCPLCFSADFQIERRICPECFRQIQFLDGIGAVFDYVGPAATLIKKMKYGDMPYLKTGLGAYLAAQFFRMEWPMPDIIVPVPMAFTHLLERGYNQSTLLAEGISSLIDRPMLEVLKRKSGDYSQAGLSRKQRMDLNGETILCKKGFDLQDKIVLLIDDVMTTGSTLRRCAEVLQNEMPKNTYALVLCRALR